MANARPRRQGHFAARRAVPVCPSNPPKPGYLRLILCSVCLRSLGQYFFSDSFGAPPATRTDVL